MLKTLLKSLRASDWGLALDFVSPSFFEVVPTLAMTRLLTVLTRQSLNKALFQETSAVWIKLQQIWMTRLFPWGRSARAA